MQKPKLPSSELLYSLHATRVKVTPTVCHHLKSKQACPNAVQQTLIKLEHAFS